MTKKFTSIEEIKKEWVIFNAKKETLKEKTVERRYNCFIERLHYICPA